MTVPTFCRQSISHQSLKAQC